MTPTDPLAFVRNYLDQFDNENWDGRGIKSATVLSAEWGRRTISGQEVDVCIAAVRLASGQVEELVCWPDEPPDVGAGHFFPAHLQRPE